MKKHEIGSRLASSNLLQDKIVVRSELVSFFLFFKLHLHEIFPKKQNFSLRRRTKLCKRKIYRLFFHRKKREVAVSTGSKDGDDGGEVEIALASSLSLSLSQDSNLIGHPS